MKTILAAVLASLTTGVICAEVIYKQTPSTPAKSIQAVAAPAQAVSNWTEIAKNDVTGATLYIDTKSVRLEGSITHVKTVALVGSEDAIVHTAHVNCQSWTFAATKKEGAEYVMQPIQGKSSPEAMVADAICPSGTGLHAPSDVADSSAQTNF